MTISINSYIYMYVYSFPRAIAHIDADCFFASVEIAKNPSLKGKPVCVCTRLDNRGIVTSASYEARPFGIKAGTAVFQAKESCPQAIFLQSHFDDYNLYAFKIFQEIRNFSPDVEVTSIDEAFVDLTGLRLLYRTSYEGIARKIQETVFQKFKIPVSIGIASTKLLAKLASNSAKPFGVLAISEKDRENFLKRTKIGKICGIGRNTEAFLQKVGYETAFDFAREKRNVIKKLLGKRGESLHFELNGITVSKFLKTGPLPKTLSHTRTFFQFLRDRDAIYKFSLERLVKLIERLRSYEMLSGGFQFLLLTQDFQGISAEHSFSKRTADNRVFIDAFRRLFEGIFKAGLTYRKAGFVLFDLISEDHAQPSLFDHQNSLKMPKLQVKTLMPALDKLTLKFGQNTILPATLLKPPIKKLLDKPSRRGI